MSNKIGLIPIQQGGQESSCELQEAGERLPEAMRQQLRGMAEAE